MMRLKPMGGWKSAMALLVFAVLEWILISLSCWQWDRAQLKQAWLDRWTQVEQATTYQTVLPPQGPDAAFTRVRLNGRWIKQSVFRWDRAYQHRAGAHIIMPLQVGAVWLMVDRGWLPEHAVTQSLDDHASDDVLVQGVLYYPQQPRWSWFAPGDTQGAWPRRLQYLDLNWLELQLEQTLYPAMLVLDEDSAGVWQMNWQPVTLSPERHRGYAVQWALLALVLCLGAMGVCYQMRRTDEP